METTFEVEHFCRVCLSPEENEKFSPIFEDNAKMAANIYKIAGIFILDVDKKVPSLICKKCTQDLDFVENLKTRILDANDHYMALTRQTEKKFLETEIKMVNWSARKKSAKKNFQPKIQEIKVKGKPIDKTHADSSENSKPLKRKLEQDYDDLSFISNATPINLGIHRMVIKKSNKSLVRHAASFAVDLTPKPSKPKASKNKNKLNRKGPSKPKNKLRAITEPKKMSNECDNCFDSCPKVNEHLTAHETS